MKPIHLLLAIIFLDISSPLIAQDCGELRDGETQRLDVPGMSLEKNKVQDQDGLGTCYANTTSVMLQSALPGNPDISYLNLALANAEKIHSKESGASFAYDKKGEPLFTGGHLCETIDSARSMGGVCKRQDVHLEDIMFKTDLNISIDLKFKQKAIIDKVSAYYEEVNNQFNQKINISKPPQKIVSAVVDENAVEPLNILGEKVPFQNFFSAISSNSSFRNEDFLAEEKKAEKKLYQYNLKQLLEKKIPEYTKKFCEKPNTKNALNVVTNLAALVYSHKKDDYSKSGNIFYPLKWAFASSVISSGSGKTETLEFEVNSDIKKALEDKYLKSIMSDHPPKSATEAFTKAIVSSAISKNQVMALLKMLDPSVLEQLEEDYNQHVLKNYSSCIEKNQYEYFKNDDGLIDDFNNSSCLSNYTHLGKSIQELVTGLHGNNAMNLSKLNEFLLNSPELSYEKSLMLVLSPGCTEDKKIRIPDDLKCTSEDIIFSSEVKENAELLTKQLALEKTKLKNIVLQSIQNQKAIGLALCTIFFKEDPNYFFNQNTNCEVSREHGRHAVSLIGLRCNKGKLDYLIQNSWGEWSDLNSKYSREGLYGKAWFNEEDIVKNTYYYSHMN